MFIYIYIYICVYVCVCSYTEVPGEREVFIQHKITGRYLQYNPNKNQFSSSSIRSSVHLEPIFESTRDSPRGGPRDSPTGSRAKIQAHLESAGASGVDSDDTGTQAYRIRAGKGNENYMKFLRRIGVNSVTSASAHQILNSSQCENDTK